ncbi:MAG: helicase-related protein [bacterium]
MSEPDCIHSYLRLYGGELGERVLSQFPALHQPADPAWPALSQLKRRPFPAQQLAIMGIAKRWNEARCAGAVAECGTGKTLISLGSVFTHANGRPFTALAMVPPQLVLKWAREVFQTLSGVRVFVIDGCRNGVGSNGFSGVNEVRLRNGTVVREGLATTLSELRLSRTHRSAKARWNAMVGGPSVFVISRERAKLGYFWRHSVRVPRSGPYLGNIVNPDTGLPVVLGDDQLRRADLRKVKYSQLVAPEGTSSRRSYFSPLWQADNQKVQRMAPIEFIGRYLNGFFDYGIADEVHELKGSDTAQGNALGTIASACGRTVVLTGTLLGGYADELFSILYRLDASRMRAEGFDHGESGVRQFAEAYGVLEKVTTIEPAENACSKAKVTTSIKRRPGASPLLFGTDLMNLAAFVSLEDISDALPAYEEVVISVEMDEPLRAAYSKLEEDIKEAISEHHGNASVISTAMNALLLYPDRPFQMGTLFGYCRNEETGERERFVISEPAELDEAMVYAKERRLVEECKRELAAGRRVQVFAVYTQKRDVTRRLQDLLRKEGIRVEVLRAEVPPEQREAWYESQVKAGMQVCICHPKLVQTGLDLLDFPTILFYETGYSTYVLRQASRRSWRIGQQHPVRVGFLSYAGTAQESCLRLMGKKLLVSLAMEGKLQSDGLQSMEDDGDLLTAMARELVNRQGVGEEAAAVWKALQSQREPIARPIDEPALVLVESPSPGDAEECEVEASTEWRIQPVGAMQQMSLF